MLPVQLFIIGNTLVKGVYWNTTLQSAGASNRMLWLTVALLQLWTELLLNHLELLRTMMHQERFSHIDSQIQSVYGGPAVCLWETPVEGSAGKLLFNPITLCD